MNQQTIEAPPKELTPRSCSANTLEDHLAQRAMEGDVDALAAWANLIDPIDDEELGWGG